MIKEELMESMRTMPCQIENINNDIEKNISILTYIHVHLFFSLFKFIIDPLLFVLFNSRIWIKRKTSEHECMSREITHFEEKEEAKINRASETCSAYKHTHNSSTREDKKKE